jgi:Protein of unknown function (DUF1552)
MFITKKHLSRRTVLKGAGVNLALPFLSAMVPASTALAQTAANPKLRAGFFYIPHGAIMHNTKFGPAQDRWTPKGSGASFTLNEINSPLEPFKKYSTIFGNLDNPAAEGSVHTRNPATWLSATLPNGNNMATTLDQEMAKFISKDTPFKWLPGTAAPLQRFLSATITRRCPWSTTLARSFCSSSARAKRLRKERRWRARTAACWT